MITFDPTISLGTIVHLLLLIAVTYGFTRSVLKRLDSIESKQDAILKDCVDAK